MRRLKRGKWMIAIVCLVLLYSGCSLWNFSKNDDKQKICVMIADVEGAEIVSENPIYINPGEEARFQVNIAPEYRLEQLSDNAVYEENTVKIAEVRYPTTIHAKVGIRPKYTMQIQNNPELGDLTCSEANPEAIYDGTKIDVNIKPKEGVQFIGFSTGNYISGGGTVVSYSENYSFVIHENQNIFVNYIEPDSQVLMFHANGGTITGNQNDFIYSASKDSSYLCPNTFPNNGQFVRDGYVVLGYNTNQDGSGEYYGCGWNVITEKNTTKQLYVQWAQVTAQTEFDYVVQADGTIAITGYHGQNNQVVIPEQIDGVAVTTISSNAFQNSNFTSLVIPRTMKTIADQAIVNCPNFTTLYFSDSVLNISDAFYNNCPQFYRLYVNASTYPKQNIIRPACYQMKYERLITAPGKKMIVVAGSNTLYGLNSPRLEEALGHEYSVVNLGINLELPAGFLAELASNFINQDDILLLAPEVQPCQFGYNRLPNGLWMFFESSYDVFSYIDIRNYTRLFETYCINSQIRAELPEQTYETVGTQAPLNEPLNIYGDLCNQRSGGFQPTEYHTLSFSPEVNITPYAQNLNAVLDLSIQKGVKVYTTFSPTVRNSIAEVSLSREAEIAYMNAIQNTIHTTVISDVDQYLMGEEYFYNSVMHLSTDGANVRTDMLSNDLKAQFEREKLGN